MLTVEAMTRVAAAVSEKYFAAHRGAVRLGRGPSVVVFGNDGYEAAGEGGLPRLTAALTRRRLEADGFAVGPVATDPDERYTWAFEAVPPAGLLDPVDVAGEVVWTSWLEAAGLDGDRDGFVAYQRRLAMAMTDGASVGAP